MSRTPTGTLPQLRLHRRTAQAVVTLTNPPGGRRDYSLGKPGENAQARYRKLLADWIAAGNEFPEPKAPTAGSTPVTIAALVASYEIHAEKYYRRANGTPT